MITIDNNKLVSIGSRLLTQDNRMTENPMFCVQIKVRDTGYDAGYCDDKCWWNVDQLECVYVEPENLDGWEEFGYKDRWETVMVAFTEKGCQEFLELDGHNVRRMAHNGEVRIYVHSFNRCPEMIAVRKDLILKYHTHEQKNKYAYREPDNKA